MKQFAIARARSSALSVLGILSVIGMLGGCDTLKSTYNNWFGAPAPSVKPAELVAIKPLVNLRVVWQGAVGPAGKSVLFPVVNGNNVWAAGSTGQIAAFNAAN